MQFAMTSHIQTEHFDLYCGGEGYKNIKFRDTITK